MASGLRRDDGIPTGGPYDRLDCVDRGRVRGIASHDGDRTGERDHSAGRGDLLRRWPYCGESILVVGVVAASLDRECGSIDRLKGEKGEKKRPKAGGAMEIEHGGCGP
jgi:hypothetical protein